jgi:hypothetical protein
MEKSIVIINPTSKDQPALARAIDHVIANHQSLDIRAVITPSSLAPSTKFQNTALTKKVNYYAMIAKNKNIKVEHSIINDSTAYNLTKSNLFNQRCAMLFKDGPEGGYGVTVNDMNLIFEAQSMINFVRLKRKFSEIKILVDIENYMVATNGDQDAIRQVCEARRMLESGANIFYFTNYKKPSERPELSKLMQFTGVNSERIIIEGGDHATSFCDTAKKLRATTLLSAAKNKRNLKKLTCKIFLKRVLSNTNMDLIAI